MPVLTHTAQIGVLLPKRCCGLFCFVHKYIGVFNCVPLQFLIAGGCCTVEAAIWDGRRKGMCNFFQVLACEGHHRSQKCEVFQSLALLYTERVIKESNMCLFCMKRAAGAECYREGTGTKPAGPIPEYDSKHTKELHELLTKSPTSLNVLGCEEDDDEEGYKKW
jgi:hypothetical protein